MKCLGVLGATVLCICTFPVLTIQERLRKQRNREYNEFIKCKEEVEMMKHAKKDQSPVRGIPVNKSSDHQSQLSPRNVHCVPSKIISVSACHEQCHAYRL